jgi:hypothetical protein
MVADDPPRCAEDMAENFIPGLISMLRIKLFEVITSAKSNDTGSPSALSKK